MKTLVDCLIIAMLFAVVPATAADRGVQLRLREGWLIQSSADVRAEGAEISTAGYQPDEWYRASVPGTVVGALVADKVFPNPNFGMNLRGIPGTDYPIGAQFSLFPMPPGSPFRVPWWYRTQFNIPESWRGKTVWLHFGGINYRADIWVNGRRIAGTDRVAGAFRVYEFDVTEAVTPGVESYLALEVYPARKHDLGITWVDWNPTPPDKNMGLWHEVYLVTSGPVAVRSPHVVTRVDLPEAKTAHLTVMADVRNASRTAVEGTLEARIGEIRVSQPVRLEAGAMRTVRFTPDEFSALNLKDPRLWWPARTGPRNLYPLEMEFRTEGGVSDRASIRFGIREVSSELTKGGHRLFRVNGKKILIRGAAWTPDMLLGAQPERQEAGIRYVRDMNLNAIRLEGKLGDDNLLELCDRYGILVMAGWCCCSQWERWKNWDAEDHRVAAESLESQVRRLRSHPSVFAWLNGSDYPPPPEVESVYLKILKEADWPNPVISSATEKKTAVTGASGVKMRGPYEWVPPSYWLTDTERGGAFGFSPETSPGPSVPPLASLRKMIPEAHLWPIDEYWNYHAGGEPFDTLKVFTRALESRYGKAAGLQDYLRKAQVMTYESHRAMFEAFGRNKYKATGVIQWMLNNAWPSLIWHLYDYYLRPAGAYFGAKKACEPLHIQYSYDDRSVVVVNSYYQAFHGLRAKATVYNFDLEEKFTREETLDIEPDGNPRAFVIPELAGLTTTYFVKLDLTDAAGKPRSSNFYWLSTKPETLDWDNFEWYYTPVKSFADLTALEGLPRVRLHLAASFETAGGEGVARVKVENPTKSLAFFTHLRVTRGAGGEEVLPVLWEDNYFPLLPGELREVKATYQLADLGDKARPAVAIDGWNVEPAAAR